eukprot:2157946-Rhodomonas_salina.2
MAVEPANPRVQMDTASDPVDFQSDDAGTEMAKPLFTFSSTSRPGSMSPLHRDSLQPLCRRCSTKSASSDCSPPPYGLLSAEASFVSTVGHASETDEETENAEQALEEMLTWEDMCQREFEVECLLRCNVNDQNSLDESIANIKSFLALFSQLRELAEATTQTTSQVFRLLTQDTAESLPAELQEIIDPSATQSVAKKLIAMVRVKVQDVADLQTAENALIDTQKFHTGLQAHAAKRGCSTMEVLTLLRA